MLFFVPATPPVSEYGEEVFTAETPEGAE
jgi:hypothetical protein